MPTTTYTIHNEDGTVYEQTTVAGLAEFASGLGHRVTAVTEGES